MIKAVGLLSIALILLFAQPTRAQQSESDSASDQSADATTSNQETIRSINEILSLAPVRDGDHYQQNTQISLKGSGKLIIYTQYKGGTPCIASREEVYLQDLDARNSTFFVQGNNMVLSLNCKDGGGHCVQRFFRNSCNISFKPNSYLTELIILSSVNTRNADKLVQLFNKLIISQSGDAQPDQQTTNNQPAKVFIPPVNSKPVARGAAQPPTAPASPSRLSSMTMDDIDKEHKQEIKPASNPTIDPSKINIGNLSDANINSILGIDGTSTDNIELEKALQQLLNEMMKDKQ
jgi:hypothetical protein